VISVPMLAGGRLVSMLNVAASPGQRPLTPGQAKALTLLTSTAAALDVIARTPPDVILLDMKMPVMDGWELARRYRQMPGPRAPIVVVTAAQDAASRAAEVAADGHLPKPFDLEDLFRVVDTYAPAI
jgi:CheY-like chemotaxis protein